MTEIKTVQEAKQFAFDLAVRGLASQGWKQCSDEFFCKWNIGRPGFHCAVGWLIPYPNQNEDRHLVSSAISKKLFVDPLNDWVSHSEIEYLIYEFQKKHDLTDDQNCAAYPELILQRFIKIGEEHELVWPNDVSQTDVVNLA